MSYKDIVTSQVCLFFVDLFASPNFTVFNLTVIGSDT